MPFSFPQPRRRRIPWGYGGVHFSPFYFGARGGALRLCALCAAGLMFLRVNSSGARMSCERREQTPKGRDGAKPASQFKRSANELRAERADPEGARRGEARESTLIRMQEGWRFFRRRAVCVVLPPFPKSSNAGGIRFLAANPQRDFLRGCPHKFLFCRCG